MEQNMICVRTTSNRRIKETRIKRQQDAIFVYIAQIMLSTSTTLEKLSFFVFLEFFFSFFRRITKEKKKRKKKPKNRAQSWASSLNTDFNFNGGACQKVTPSLEEHPGLAKKYA